MGITVWHVVGAGVAFLALQFVVSIVILSIRMYRAEKRLARRNIVPAGSTLSHGMVRVREGGKVGVQHDEKPTDSWYANLLR